MKNITIRRILHKIVETYWDFTNHGATVLTFHQVNNDKALWDFWFTSITLDNFKKFISQLEQSNIKFVSLQDLEANDNVNDRHLVSITFDDGYAEIYYDVYPLLKQKHIPFTIFITWEFLNSRNYISIEQLLEMADNPLCTVGSHCIHHVSMRRLNIDETLNEIQNSKILLENLIHKHIHYFAFPFGNLENISYKSLQLVKDNYNMAFSTLSSQLSSQLYKRNKYILPRINIADYSYQKILKKYLH